MFEVWISNREGTRRGPRFRLLGDALRFIDSSTEQSSLAIRYPNGSWHCFGNGRAILVNRRRAPRRRVRASITLRRSDLRDRLPLLGVTRDVCMTGIRLRLLRGQEQPVLGTRLICSLSARYTRCELQAYVAWASTDDLGLMIDPTDGDSLIALTAWLDQPAGEAHIQPSLRYGWVD